MLQIESDAPPDAAHTETLTLPFDLRRKSRQRARLDSGLEAALVMSRGRVLRHGDLLRSTDGVVVMVQAADELVSTVSAADPVALARGAYHLGNRHVSLQIGDGWMRYQHDHVLDEMVRRLGLEVATERAAFEPESGAYQGHGAHGHSHD